MKHACPGAKTLRTPGIIVLSCPVCGGRIEIFTDEMKAECSLCGHAAHRELRSCVRWCSHAAECVGEDVYLKLTANTREAL